MSRRSFRIALIVVVGSILLGGGAIAYLIHYARTYPTRAHHGTGELVAVDIEPGMSFPAIANRLAERGIIDRPLWFRLYGMYRGVTTDVRSGKYQLRDDLTPEEVLTALLAGVREETIAVTIPEGLHMLEVFDLIARANIADAGELERLARDPAFLARHGIEGDTVDGYLFPETYNFPKSASPELVLDTMIKQHQITWDKVRRRHNRDIQRLGERLGWTDRQFLVLASIVEKEAVRPEERPRIAQVFINRLTAPTFVPHRLDTDPTIRYGCMVPLQKSAGCLAWDPTQRLRRAQLDDVDNLYNTYQHEGLPPGPICNPGEASLEAAVDPDGSGFFYFVARNDGSHAFARTRAEHERNVDRFQR